MLKVKDLVIKYGSVEALKGLSIDVAEGHITTLIGANGAGKSTFLKAISGLVPIVSGEIWFNNIKINGKSPEKISNLGIAHVPQGKRLFTKMSVADNLAIGAYTRKDRDGIKRDLEKVYEAFPVLKVRSRALAKNLSGGEQQMLAFGRGLMSHPKLLILDEPSLGLAPLMVNVIAEHIKKFAQEGYTVILVEQNANLALALAKYAYVLELGSVVLEGEAKQVQDNDHVRKAYLGM
jgi:branched-chain amino acid transport system ATP-binding protein